MSSVALAQPGWEWQNPLPQGYNLNAVAFSDTNNGWAVGDGGSIIHTSDAGDTWVLQPSYTMNTLRGVCFSNASTGTAVGDSGIILQTYDGGSTWLLKESGTTNDLLAITYSSALIGWAVGRKGIILHTTDGGISWKNQVSTTTNDLHAVSFTDDQIGYSVGNKGTILRTTNGGTMWIGLNSGTSYDLLGIASVSSSTAVAIGGAYEFSVQEYGHTFDYYYSTLYRTTNGGSSWTMDSLTGGNGYTGFTSMHFINPSQGWIVGLGEVYKTTDGGSTWSSVITYSPGGPGGIFFTDSNSGFIVGEQGEIYHTTNGGQSWVETAKNATGSFGLPYSNLFFVNSSVGWCFGSSGGNGGIMRTTNGGENWSVQWSADPTSTDLDLTSAFFVDVNNGWVFGHYYDEQYGRQQGMLLHTSDAGKSWENEIPPLTDIIQPNNVFFLNPNIGWLTDGWSMYRTSNGGKSWPLVSNGAVKHFDHIYFSRY